MRRWLIALTVLATAWPVSAQDTDGDGIPDAVEEQIGSDPALATPLEVVYEDHAKGEGDESVGDDLQVAHDLVSVAFGGVARDRWVWRLDFTEPWVVRGDVALIVYTDADNDPDTGRQGGGVQGTDLMVRPTGASGHGRPGAPRYTSAADGNSLYLAFDSAVNVEDGRAVCRAYVLIQNRESTSDADRTPWFEANAPMTDAAPPDLPEDHPMHIAPEAIGRIRARVPIDDGGRRAIITWITSWPTEATVQFGETEDYGRSVMTGRQAQNHRAVLEGLEPGRTYHYRIRCRGALGALVSSDDLIFSTAVREPAGDITRDRIPLTVNGAPGERRPVTSGIPFPEGALGSGDHVRVLDPSGAEVPLQTEVLTRWPGGTVRWLLLDFQADVPDAGEADYVLEFGTDVARAAVEAPIAVEQDDEAIVVDTGALRVRFDPDEFAFLGEAWLDIDGDGRYTETERITDPDGAGIVLTDLEGEQFTSLGAPDELAVTRRGPLHTVVTARGPHRSASGETLFRYELRMHFYAGLPLVRVLHSFENDRVQETFTTVRSLDLRIPLAGGAQGGTMLLPDGATAELGPGGRLLQSDDDRFHAEGADAAGERAPGAMSVSGDRADTAIALRNFWQLWPKSLDIDPQGAVIGIMPELPEGEYADIAPELEDKLYYALLGGVYKLHSGVAKTHELLVRFCAEERALSSLTDQANAPALAFAPAAWYCDSKAFGDITPRTPGEFERYDAMADRVLESILRERESGREYGMLNFGDWWGERGFNWGNIEYDTQHGLFLQFARSARRDFFDNAVYAARHNIDVDIIHHSRDAQMVGIPYYHCLCHTGDYYPDGYRPSGIFRGGWNTGHLWTRGNLEYSLLSGDGRARRIALQTADYLAGPLMTSYHMSKGAERATAWPLFGLLAAYEATADEYYLNAVRIITRDVIAEQDRELGHWHIPAGYSKVKPTPIGGYAWCAGLLITSLEFANRYLHDPEIDDTIVRAARWLARDEWIPERKGFRSASCPTLEASVTPGFECYRTPTAMLRAYELTGDEQFLRIAHVGFSYAVAKGGAGGKGGSVQLTITPHAVYKLKQAGITSLDTSEWEEAARLYTPGWVPVERGKQAQLYAIIESNRDEPLEATVAVRGLPEGIHAPPPLAAGIAGRQTETLRVDLPDLGLQPGDALELTLTMSAGDTDIERRVVMDCPAAGDVGDAIGLIAGDGDFLGPAFDELGVAHARVEDLAALPGYGAIFLGTQAHTLNAAGIAEQPELLLHWVHAGGTLVLSQLNDDGWETRFLPGVVVLAEENSVSGEIVAPRHPLFTTPNEVADLSGVEMYDSIAIAHGWSVLVEDERGRPAVIETACGDGRILVLMPSFERHIGGPGSGGPCRHLLENVVAWATAGPGR